LPPRTRILFVDDDADTRDVMTRLLRRQGYEVFAAGTCESAIRSAERAPIDLLITDFLLPDGDGLSVLQKLRNLRFSPATDVQAILVSGVDGSDAGQVMEIAAPRFARCLMKPIHFDDLLAAIEHVMDTTRAQTNFTDADRTRARVAALRDKVRTMTNEELGDLVQVLKRRGDDLKEELTVLGELLAERKASTRDLQ
jgi:DNA-binding response OmpR family regulator